MPKRSYHFAEKAGGLSGYALCCGIVLVISFLRLAANAGTLLAVTMWG